MPMSEQPLTSERQSQIRDCIRAYITAKGITKEELAHSMGYSSAQTVHNYLSTKPLSERTIKKFSEALEYPYELLLKGEPYYGPGAYAALEARVAALEGTIKRMQQALFGPTKAE